MLFTRAFWLSTLERSVATGAEAMAATMGADGLGVLNVGPLDVLIVGSLGALAALVKCVAALRLAGDTTDPASLVDLPGKHAQDR